MTTIAPTRNLAPAALQSLHHATRHAGDLRVVRTPHVIAGLMHGEFNDWLERTLLENFGLERRLVTERLGELPELKPGAKRVTIDGIPGYYTQGVLDALRMADRSTKRDSVTRRDIMYALLKAYDKDTRFLIEKSLKNLGLNRTHLLVLLRPET